MLVENGCWSVVVADNQQQYSSKLKLMDNDKSNKSLTRSWRYFQTYQNTILQTWEVVLRKLKYVHATCAVSCTCTKCAVAITQMYRSGNCPFCLSCLPDHMVECWYWHVSANMIWYPRIVSGLPEFTSYMFLFIYRFYNFSTLYRWFPYH